MKCDIKKIEPRVCKTCGFKTDNMLITLCPRCMGSLPGPTLCSGGCGGCGAKH